MALKGNLLYNGDFGTGTTEEWIKGIFGLDGCWNWGITTDRVYRGNYALHIGANYKCVETFIGYDDSFSLEEYEAYLFTGYCYQDDPRTICPVVYFLRDDGGLERVYWAGVITDAGKWVRFIALIRAVGMYSRFTVGFYFKDVFQCNHFYIDEVALMPFRRIKGIIPTQEYTLSGVNNNRTYYLGLSAFGATKVRSSFMVTNVSGESPSLTPKLEMYYSPEFVIHKDLEHSTFTSKGFEEKTLEVGDAGYIHVSLTVGGSSPSFDIRHRIALEPL